MRPSWIRMSTRPSDTSGIRSACVLSVEQPERMMDEMARKIRTDIAVIGGGLGGTAAALAILRAGHRVILTEETVWVGGQATSQGVPPDEHRQIETCGCTALYRHYRDRVRQYYRDYYPLTDEARFRENLNPGGGSVSQICHEPKVSARVLTDLLAPYVSSGQLEILYQARPVSAVCAQNQVRAVVLETPAGQVNLDAEWFLDATECGDLLPLTGTEYVTGRESRADTGEDHAGETADPLDMQAVTWCFAVSLEPSGHYTITKPPDYERYSRHLSDFWPGSQLSWTYSQPVTLEPVEGCLEKQPGKIDLFTYRKILGKESFAADYGASEITLVNWPQNDYWLGPLFDVPDEDKKRHLAGAKELSRCFLYWLQTEAPRADGGQGYPNLRPRGDVMGTDDGFAMMPYIRESRRIVPLFRVLESHVGLQMRRAALSGRTERITAAAFPDSVGIGYYRIDLHPSTGQRNYIDVESLPFQIPLGALIPVRTANLLAAGKNIGTTHITNGCYRLHAVEWNIGEAAGACAAWCLTRNMTAARLWQDRAELDMFRAHLRADGIELDWPDEWRTGL